MVKTKISDSWNWIEIEDMTDQKYDVFDNYLAGGVKWRCSRQDSGQVCT